MQVNLNTFRFGKVKKYTGLKPAGSIIYQLSTSPETSFLITGAQRNKALEAQRIQLEMRNTAFNADGSTTICPQRLSKLRQIEQCFLYMVGDY